MRIFSSVFFLKDFHMLGIHYSNNLYTIIQTYANITIANFYLKKSVFLSFRR